MVDQVSKEQEAAWERGLETEGEAQVRLKFSAGFYGSEHRVVVVRWLARKEHERLDQDQERRARIDASISEQMALTRESNAIASDVKTNARQDRTVALATLIVAMIGSAAAIIGLFIR